MEDNNEINIAFLDSNEKKFSYSVMIVLDAEIVQEQFMLFKNKSDFVICADGAANRVYDTFYATSEE
jgi:thiamine pyrophosphokinase